MDGEVLFFDQQPVFAIASLGSDQGELAHEALSVKPEFQVAGIPLLDRGFCSQPLVSSTIPESYLASAVVAAGDGAFEIAVVQGVIFHVYSQPFYGRIESGAVG